MRAILAAVLCSCIFASDALAHGDLHEAIERLTQDIDRGSATAELYLKRGELHRTHGDVARALTDFARAEELDPRMSAVHLCRGLALLAAREFEQARASLDRFLVAQPKHIEGLAACARTLAAMKLPAAAARDYDRCIALAAEPKPEFFLERAEALAAIPDLPAAVRSLDEGVHRLGNLTTLHAAALALELKLERHDAALARIDTLLVNRQRTETWHVRRAEILLAANRHDEGQRAYRAALAALDLLPAGLRNSKPTRELERKVHHALALTASPSPAEAPTP